MSEGVLGGLDGAVRGGSILKSVPNVSHFKHDQDGTLTSKEKVLDGADMEMIEKALKVEEGVESEGLG